MSPYSTQLGERLKSPIRIFCSEKFVIQLLISANCCSRYVCESGVRCVANTFTVLPPMITVTCPTERVKLRYCKLVVWNGKRDRTCWPTELPGLIATQKLYHVTPVRC